MLAVACLATPARVLADSDGLSLQTLPIGTMTVLTVLLCVWLAVVWRVRVMVLDRVKNLAIEKSRGLASPRLRRIGVQKVVRIVRSAMRLASSALVLGGLFLWATLMLDAIPQTRPFAEEVEGELLAKLRQLGLAAVSVLPNLAVIGLIFFLTRVAHELLNHYFRSIADGDVESTVFDPVTAETTRKLVDLGIWIAAVVIAFPYLPGSDSAAFRGVSVLAGLMLSLGSANLVSQFTSGLSLIYSRAIRPDDYVEVGQIEGTVERVGLFACMVRTPRDEVATLPHTVVAAALKNFSRGEGGVRFAATVTIGYDSPAQTVRELLLAAAEATAGVRAVPAPAVRQAALEDFYVRYELLFTPDDPKQRVELLGRLHERITEKFHAAGVQIMSPHYHGDPAAPKVPPVAKA